LRWIENPKLSRAFVRFSRGPRGVLGTCPSTELSYLSILVGKLTHICSVNLARRYIHVLLVAILVKYDVYKEGGGKMGPTLQVLDTTKERDIDTNSEYIIPAPARGSEGLMMVARR
jgi:hypothetical protein